MTDTAAARRLAANDLMPLEQYARERADFRARVIEHKKRRTVAVGPNLTLLFEDRLTIQYQVQEMLRIERIFEPEGIADELAAYNPLIPDGSNFKATLLIEFPDVAERQRQLALLKGVEDRVYLAVGSLSRIYAIADEDLDRENDTKTSAVHFTRFELGPEHRAALRAGEPLCFGVDHPAYRHEHVLDAHARAALLADLAPA
jgi:Protein of unknown function (DUF3501)